MSPNDSHEDSSQRREFEESAQRRLIIEFFQNSHVPMWATDEHHRIVLWNRGAEEIYGYDADDVLGRSYLDLFIDPDEREESEKDAIEIIQKNKKFRNYLASDTGHDGEPKDMLTNCFRIRDPESREAFQAEVSVHIPEFDLRDAERAHGRLLEAMRARRQEEAALLTGQKTAQRHVIAFARKRLAQVVEVRRIQLNKLETSWHRSDRDRNERKRIAAESLKQVEADAERIALGLDEVERLVSVAEKAQALQELDERIHDVERQIEGLLQ